jgi:hypothetical protein
MHRAGPLIRPGEAKNEAMHMGPPAASDYSLKMEMELGSIAVGKKLARGSNELGAAARSSVKSPNSPQNAAQNYRQDGQNHENQSKNSRKEPKNNVVRSK